MADRGGDQNNPFSFKTFVSDKDNKTKLTDELSGDEDDIFGLNKSVPKSKKTEKLKIEGQEDTTTKVKSKKDKAKENPFSFKKFLSAPEKSTRSDNSASRALPPDIATDVPLFVNEHFTDTHHRDDFRPLSNAGGRVPPLDSTDDCDNFTESKQTFGATAASASLVGDNISPFDDADINSDDVHTSSALHLGLPDFLSDGAILNTVSHDGDISPERCQSRSRDHDEDLYRQIRIMQDENERLRSELSREKQRCSDKNQKLSEMKIQLERQRKKESEETAVMERAVMQVEENLVATTSRAVQAEANATKLKQEVKSLQNQVKSLTSEVEVLKSGDSGLSDLRERTKYSAEQLRDAAVSAERNLKELLSGVDKLKLVSLVLSSIEKVSDVPPDPTDQQDAKPS